VALRQLDKGFDSIGCPHPGVECLIAQLTKLMVHYGCRSGVGLQLQVSMEMMIIELGLSLQPLQESFCTYGKWVTNTWLKLVWEKVKRFNIKVEITPLAIQPPRAGDQWFMQSVINTGVVTRPEELAIINRVQCYQQVLFISDVLDAGGLCLDRKYLKRRPFGDSWSTQVFLIEQPTRGQFKLWEKVLLSIAPQGCYGRRIGRLLTKGHKIWEWQIDEESWQLFHIKGQTMDIYMPSTIPSYANRPNCWTRSEHDRPLEEQGTICLVRNVSPIVLAVTSSSAGPPIQQLHKNLWDIIKGWGNTWIWENLTIRGEVSWLEDLIKDNSLLAVTDGSYMKDTYPHLNLVAFFFECTNGRGQL
jgi:hypothetical protein